MTPGRVYNFTVCGASTYNNDGETTTGVFDGQTIKAVGGSIGETVGLISGGGTGGDRILCLGDIRFSGGNGGTSKGDSDGIGAGGGAGSTANGAYGNSSINTFTGGAGGTATNYNGGSGGNGGNSRSAGRPASTSGYGGGGSGDLNGAAYVTRAGGSQNGAIIITSILP